MNLLKTTEQQQTSTDDAGNQLFPIFLKLNELRVVLIGAGNIGLEKLTAMLNNSPGAHIRIITQEVSADVYQLVESYPDVTIEQRSFQDTDLDHANVAIVATNNNELNHHIREQAKQRNLLVNFADKPSLCDFYLGSVIQKGNLKVAISTNGKSPTIAKRLKQVIEDSLPDSIDQTLDNMSKLRTTLKGNFTDKLNKLNEVTAMLISTDETDKIGTRKQ